MHNSASDPNPSETLQSLFDTYGRNLLACAYRILGDYHAAQDVVQDAFIKYYRLHKRNGAIRHPHAWLRRVASNAAIDAARRRTVLAETDLASWEAFGLPGIEPADKTESATLASVLGKLHAKEREILELRAIDNLSFREIAEKFGCSENAAQKCFDRVRNRLQKHLKN